MRKKRKNKQKGSKPRDLPKIKEKFLAILFLFFGFLLIFSFFGAGGIVGKSLTKFLYLLFGKSEFLLPLVFILIGIFFLFSFFENKILGVISLFVFLFCFSGILSLFELKNQPDKGFALLQSGGWAGTIISYPLVKLFGIWPIASIFLLLQCLLLVFLAQPFFKYLKKQKEKKPQLIGAPQKKIVNVKKIFAPRFRAKPIEEVSIEIAPKPTKEKTQLKEIKIKTPIEVEGGKLPPLDLLEEDKEKAKSGDINANLQIIKKTLANFGIQVEMTGANVGPTVTQYTLKPAEGVKLSKITALANNLALALAAHPIRIEAPIPGKSLVGIEVPNQKRALVRLRNLLATDEFQNSSSLTFALGRDVVGQPVFADLGKMPHLLIAGSTGTGKTIALNSIIISLLYKNTPNTLRFILVDPKRVEFTAYNNIPHLLCPVVWDADKTVNALLWLVEEMERRFDLFSEVGARDLRSFNEKIEKNSSLKKEGFGKLPYIVLIIDELADLMATRGKDIEAGIVRLAQKARATGIHLILATQRPSVEVITGLIKANIIARIAFQVASQIDSRTILDAAGAEKLLGSGDMLFVSSAVSKPRRIQGAYVSEKEIQRVVEFVCQNQKIKGIDDLAESLDEALRKEKEEISGLGFEGGEDPLYEEAKRLVLATKKASASFLQRKLRIGYARAARLLDMMEERGIVGPARGAKPREVYGERENVEEDFGNDYNEEIK